MAEKYPDPGNDRAMRELAEFVASWTQRHQLDATVECRYLSLFVAGRLDVQSSLARCRQSLADEDGPLT